MASLPPGWEPDYDGTRWLYRYTPTGLTQFTFPQPGDEFPDFDAPGAGPITLAPEERLASERQIKLRKRGMLNAEEVKREVDGDGKEDDDTLNRMSATGYFDPSEFMYYEEGDDGGDLTPIARRDDNQPRFPLGFVAELPSSDIILCAEELAPVELDAGACETTTTTNPVEKVNEASSAISLPPSPSPHKTFKTLDHDDIYSADTPTHIQPSLSTVLASRAMEASPHHEIDPSANPVTTRQHPQSPKSRFSFTPIPQPVSGLPKATEEKRMGFSKSHGPVSAMPLVSTSFADHRAQRTLTPGRSIDDIQAMPSSLQPHQPLSNRTRSKSATYEPWRPTIKFVQTGLMQESQVSTPGLSGISLLHQQDQNSGSVGDTRMSAWLIEQALGRPPSDPYKADSLDRDSSGIAHNKAIDSVEQQGHDKGCSSPEPRTSESSRKGVTLTTFQPPFPPARIMQSEKLPEQQDRVIETIIDVPAMENGPISRGVQLVDVSPGFSRSSMEHRRATKEKRFSWESEVDGRGAGVKEHSAAPDSPITFPPVAITPQENGDVSTKGPLLERVTDHSEDDPPSVAHAAPHQGRAVMCPSPRASAVPSPRLPFDTFSPTHGQITANKVVLVEPTFERKASIATIEVGLQKPLPPLPLASKGQPIQELTSKHPTSHAFDQISELIAVANAAMPSARPLSAVPPGPSAESVWRSLRTQALRSARSPGFGAPATKSLELPNRTNGRSRSNSQLTGPNTSLAPPARHHSRSRSLNAAAEFPPTRPRPFNDSGLFVQTPADGYSSRPKAQERSVPADGHKSHKRLSIHATPAGLFAYHPLRSSPVFAPTSDAHEIQEPQPVDYVKDQALSLLQPKPKSDRTSRPSKEERPRLQVKSPFIGLPSSPRPSPRPRMDPQPEENAIIGADELTGQYIKHEVFVVRQASVLPHRRPSTQSQVSSPTSSIFSSMRDSSVSATSSMADIDSTPLSEGVPNLDKSQGPYFQQQDHLISGDKEEFKEQMSAVATGTHGVPSLSSVSLNPPTLPKVPQVASVSAQRPPNVPEAIRPAGTRASLWGSARPREDPIDQPLIPTVIVRAPTVKARPLERQEMHDKQPSVPHVTKLPLAAPREDGVDAIDHIDKVAQPMVEVARLNHDSEEQIAPPTKPQGFMQSLRQSWQFTTSNAPRLSLLAGQGHVRSKSQSTLTEPQGKVAEAIAMAKRHAVMPWQWTDRDRWPTRDSLPVDTGSISNVEATIRFFNSSFQARRPQSDSIDHTVLELSRRSFEDDKTTSTIVVRRVGPPVVVRVPC